MNQLFKKWGLLSIVLVFMMALLIGCGGTQDKEQDTKDEDVVTEEETTNQDSSEISGDQQASFPVTITDEAGREVTIDSEPESIVSIQASNTEILFALGVGDKVIGVSEYCNFPEEVNDIQKVGAQDMDAEVILSLLPDIAFVTNYHYKNHDNILKQFEDAGITVVVTGSPESFDDVYQTMDMIGIATGSAEIAEELTASLKQDIDDIKEKASAIEDKKRVWVEVSPAPDIFTTGKGTFMNEMLETIHAENVAGEEEGWVKLTEEEIVQFNPDVIVTTYGYYVDNPSDDVLKRDGWAEVPAVKNEQVFDVSNDTVNRPGPRLVEGVETLAEAIYPEVFKK